MSEPSDAYVIPFAGDEPPPLPLPDWAKHLHECQHRQDKSMAAMARSHRAQNKKIEGLADELRTQRHDAANRRMATEKQLNDVQATLNAVLAAIGKESDDGKGGTGLVGQLRRVAADVTSLMAERNMIRGALAAVTASAVILGLGVKAWVLEIVKSAK